MERYLSLSARHLASGAGREHDPDGIRPAELRRSRCSREIIHGLLMLSLVAALPTALAGQADISARGGEVRFGGRLHTQFATSSAEEGKATDFFTRRARLTIDVRVTPLLDARVQPDFGGGKLELKDAYFRLGFDRALRVSMGQFKRAFDLFELNSSTEIVVVERTGRIDGLEACAGVGGVCSLSRFTEKLGYSDRDIGVKVDGSLGERVRYMATLTNGTGTSGSDENSGKSLAARLSLDLTDDLTLAGNVSRHDYLDSRDSSKAATAFGADLELGGFRDGTHLQLGLVAGANWLESTEDGPPRFLAWQGILSRYFPLEGSRLEAIEPMARVSWGDPERAAPTDAGMVVTPGLFLYIKGRNRIGANLDIYRQGPESTHYSCKIQSYLYY
ncbi:MAG: porin [Gemmatimonadetes bacterium]|nr:porin [Gemmatimonadota bacterium]MCY3942720.1 porin [Gemmatimonadota bacterium]